jgi:hypothetical protein
MNKLDIDYTNLLKDILINGVNKMTEQVQAQFHYLENK